MAENEAQTPLMKQFWALKNQVPDSLLFFRMGDFYELFGDDARTASQILKITLTSRDKSKPDPMPMAGVPHHSIDSYIQKLLKAGKKVAIGEQIGDPAATKGIVKREITRCFTPAVNFNSEDAENSYLATAYEIQKSKSPRWVLSLLDPSTGQCLVSDALDEEGLMAEVLQLPIRHFLHREGENLPSGVLSFLSGKESVLVEKLPPNYLLLEQAKKILETSYAMQSLQAFLSRSEDHLALATLVHYTLKSQQLEKLDHLQLPLPLHQAKTLILGPCAPAHLDLIPSATGAPSLFDLINRTCSSLGARQLRRWLLSPLQAPSEIEARQKAIHFLASHTLRHEKIRTSFREVYDLERIMGRVSTGLANPRDTLALAESLKIIPEMAQTLTETDSKELIETREELQKNWITLEPTLKKILQNQKSPAPILSREGGIFNIGTQDELDRLISLTEEGENWLLKLEADERSSTGISSLKVRYNRVFGYYIEVTKVHLKNVPAHYQRKQSTVNAERFFTEELKKFEDEMLSASSKRKSLEQQLFDQLLVEIKAISAVIIQSARLLGEIDALNSLASLTYEAGWTFPVIDESLEIQIEDGRHPIVDQALRGSFVPNDLVMNPDESSTLLITGPNMGGKSTVMRQAALIVILGQMGAPVPAKSARWGSVHSIHTRIGAHDAIAHGQSTFMVEMSELAYILHNANERSLIILDEIGRGTSTYDGISVAWATLEWISKKIKGRTLFATHYHELTLLVSSIPSLKNVQMRVASDSKSGSLRFLYKMDEGAANESFGIQVAQMAGLPKGIIQRAWKVLEELEQNNAHLEQASSGSSPGQLSLFSGISAEASKPEIIAQYEPHPLLEDIRKLDLNAMTPLQALTFLAQAKDRSEEQAARQE